ncbi:MAG TPA: nitrate- and nitrite sensing domain-containing protein, partial [Ramlibacter sp.]|nr:nitrate- and nitrite sensing domain-containing protein [Ramlibacter sp.]
MKSGLSFLLAARQCEIGELERLALTSDLVSLLGRFTHALQRERGLSNLYLSTKGDGHAHERAQQAAKCDVLQAEVVAHFDQLDTQAGMAPNGARLFSRIAVLLHGLEALP